MLRLAADGDPEGGGVAGSFHHRFSRFRRMERGSGGRFRLEMKRKRPGVKENVRPVPKWLAYCRTCGCESCLTYAAAGG